MFEPVEFGNLTVDPFEIQWKGETVALRPTERQLVLRLLLRLGQVVSWHQLVLELGLGERYNDQTYGALRCNVYRARRRFRAIDPSFDKLVTVAKAGYRWEA